MVIGTKDREPANTAVVQWADQQPAIRYGPDTNATVDAPSSEAPAIRAEAYFQRSMRLNQRLANGFPAVTVPQSHGAIVTRGGEQFTVRRESAIYDRIVVMKRRRERLASPAVPNSRCSVHRGSSESLAVRRPLRPVGVVVELRGQTEACATLQIPES